MNESKIVSVIKKQQKISKKILECLNNLHINPLVKSELETLLTEQDDALKNFKK